MFFLRWSCTFIILIALAGCKEEEKISAAKPENVSAATHSAGEESWPDEKILRKLATSAIRDFDYQTSIKVANVEITGNFPDASKKVNIMLDSGRTVPGRLYKERRRCKIAIDRQEFYSVVNHIKLSVETDAKK